MVFEVQSMRDDYQLKWRIVRKFEFIKFVCVSRMLFIVVLLIGSSAKNYAIKIIMLA